MPIRTLVATTVIACSSLSLTASASAQQDVPDALKTVAEASDYTRTASHAQVMELLDAIGERSSIMRRGELGVTNEGRVIPLAILANPPVANAEQAHATGKPIAFIFANIHAGEVCGKEATLQLIREIALNPDHPLLKDLVIVFAPIYNADGNERFGPNNRNRPGQNGPEEMGRRPNAQGLDLNRDYIKLESPEARAMVAFYNQWQPHVSMDLHTTNGSRHRLTLTYEYPLNPSGHPEPIAFVRDEILPTVRDRLEEATGYLTFHYGNLNRAQTTWTTYDARPRFGGQYLGLRNHMNILSEAYSYAPFKDRVICTREFVRQVLIYTAENGEQIMEITNRANAATIAKGANPQPSDFVGLRHRVAANPTPATIPGYQLERTEDGRRLNLDKPVELQVVHRGRFEPTLSVRRPHAYILDPGMDRVIEKLRQHGVEMKPFEGKAVVEQYTLTRFSKARRAFQDHQIATAEATSDVVTHTAPVGSWIVSTAQPLGNLIVYMLEPQSEDGLLAWNYFDDHVSQGAVFPVRRVRTAHDLKR